MVRRLSKVAREFNIGTSVIVEYLDSQGISIESSPNTKISPEVYEIIYEEFSGEKSVKKKVKEVRSENKKNPSVVGKIELPRSVKGDIKKPKRIKRKRVVQSSNDKSDSLSQVDIWKAHIEAQELLLTSLPPFYLDPESVSEISRGQYRAQLDFSIYRELAEDYAKRLFNNSDTVQVDIDKGILSVPDNVKIDLSYFNSVYESALTNYLKLYNQPAVMFRVDAENTEESSWSQIADKDREGIIEAKRGIAYLSISEIERLLGSNNGIQIEDKFVAVLNGVKPNIEFYEYAFNQANVEFSDFRSDKDSYSFYVYNQWINEEEMNRILSLGLFDCRYIELTVNIEDNDYLYTGSQGSYWRRSLGVLLQMDNSDFLENVLIRLPNPDPEGYFSFKIDSTVHPRSFSLFRKQLLEKLKSVFGDSVKAEYRYLFKCKSLFDQQLDGWKDYLQENLAEGIAYNFRQNVISFDFESPQELEQKVKSLIDIKFLDTEDAFNSDYYYKVVYTYDSELIFLKNIIKEHYPTINIVQTANKRSLVCSLHYHSGDVYSKSIVLNKLKSEITDFLNDNSMTLKMISYDENKDYYPIEFRAEDIESDLSGLLRKIRGDYFGIKKDEKFVPVAKLFKVKYPVVFFDTSEFTNSFILEEIVPFYGNFKGDQDKLKRLKSTIDKIYSDRGSRCLNPRVKDFMHDASSLHAEEDLERLQDYLDLKEDVSKNLLGKRVNEKQLEAIAKSLFAKDLFVIQGPPGTGKSTGISEITWQHIRQNELSNERNDNFKILITSETNLAVDNALDKLRSNEHVLIKPVRFGSEIKLDKEGLRFSIAHIDKWVSDNYYDDLFEGDFEESDELSEEREEMKESLNNNIVKDWMNQIITRCNQVNHNNEANFLEYWESFLSQPDFETRKLFRDTYVKGVNVVGSTCSTIGKLSSTGKPTSFFRDYCSVYHPDKNVHSVRSIEFDVAIQDEASKASPPELAIPMVYSRKNIVLGDHRQLPPLVNPDDFIEEIKLASQKSKDQKKSDQIQKLVQFIRKERDSFDKSYFEKIYSEIHPTLKTSFNEQYRMHSSINNVIRQFYINDNGLECGLDYTASNSTDIKNPSSRYHGINIPGFMDENRHVVWVNTNSAESIDNASRSRYNLGEIDVIERILELFSKNASFWKYNDSLSTKEDREIGIITFYGAQLKRMRKIKESASELNLRISSVDRFQGMERNIVIVSTVRSNKLSTYDGQPLNESISQSGLGFADSPNRLNVALSRAKRLLIIVGNSDHFTSESHGEKSLIYRNVLSEIQDDPKGHCLFIDSKELFAE